MVMIGIAGKAGSGKDTLAQYIRSVHSHYDILHLAAPIKHGLNAMFGWDDTYWEDRHWKEAINPVLGFSPREAAQKLGTEWRDIMDKSGMMWCRSLEAKATRHDLKMKHIIVPDIRFEHEQDWVHSHSGIVVYIHRDNLKAVASHSSENGLNTTKLDLIIPNNDTVAKFQLNGLRSIEALGVKL